MPAGFQPFSIKRCFNVVSTLKQQLTLFQPYFNVEGRSCAGVVPNSAPCQIMHPLVLVGLGLGVGEGLGLGVGLGLGNQVAISTRGCIIWQGCRFRHNTGWEVADHARKDEGALV